MQWGILLPACRGSLTVWAARTAVPHKPDRAKIKRVLLTPPLLAQEMVNSLNLRVSLAGVLHSSQIRSATVSTVAARWTWVV